MTALALVCSVLPMATNQPTSTDFATTQLGAFPFTYSADSESWRTARCYDVTVDGTTWTVNLSLEGAKVALYAWNDDGDSLNSSVAYAPALTLGVALANMLR